VRPQPPPRSGPQTCAPDLGGTSIGGRVGGFFGSFVAALLSIPVAGALQVIARELWQITGQPGPPDSERVAGPEPGAGGQQTSGTHRGPAMASVVDDKQ